MTVTMENQENDYYIRALSFDDFTRVHGYHLTNIIANVINNEIMIPYTVIDEDGNIAASTLYNREMVGNQNGLVVRLVRAPLEKEWSQIQQLWILTVTDIVSKIQTNATTSTMERVDGGNHISEPVTNNLSSLLTERQHQEWVSRMMSDGWSYDIRLSEKLKTHPMIRPWDELPSSIKLHTKHQPYDFLTFLAENGYTIIKQSELDRLINSFIS